MRSRGILDAVAGLVLPVAVAVLCGCAREPGAADESREHAAGALIEPVPLGVRTASEELARRLSAELSRQSRGTRADGDGTETVVPASDPSLTRRRSGEVILAGARFDGVLEDRYPDGAMRSRETLRSGERDGVTRRWHENGQLCEERLFARGEKHGLHVGWWPDGTLRFVSRFRHGAHQETSRTWHANGRLATLRTHEEGVEEGPQRSWTPDGRVLANYQVRDGRRYGLLGAKSCFTVVDGRQRTPEPSR